MVEARRPWSERGQASLEVLAGIPALTLAALIGAQLLAVGYTSSLADGAVHAGAMALAAGEDPQAAVRGALPGWARERVSSDVDGGTVSVTLRPPALLGVVAERLEVDATGWARPAS